MKNSKFLSIMAVGTAIFTLFQDNIDYFRYCTLLAFSMSMVSLICQTIEDSAEKISQNLKNNS